jgi:hypothetical protein
VPAVNDAPHHVSPYSDSWDSRSNAGALGSYQQPTAEEENFDTIAATDLHSTSEALNLLSRAAQLQAHGPPGHPYETDPSMSPSPLQGSRSIIENGNDSPLRYPLVDQGLLTRAQISQLVTR